MKMTTIHLGKRGVQRRDRGDDKGARGGFRGYGFAERKRSVYVCIYMCVKAQIVCVCVQFCMCHYVCVQSQQQRGNGISALNILPVI